MLVHPHTNHFIRSCSIFQFPCACFSNKQSLKTIRLRHGGQIFVTTFVSNLHKMRRTLLPLLGLLASTTLSAAAAVPPPAAAANSSTAQKPGGKVDYVIVGGGPAGFVVAEQLSRNPKVRVTLLEAGPDASQDPVINSKR